MSMNDAHDARLDRGLRAIGEHLPEPAPSPDTCARLTRMIDGAPEPAAAGAEHRQGWGGRLHRAVGALAAIIVLGGLVWVVLAPQKAANDPNEPATVNASGAITLVNFHHDACPVSKQMDPRFQELAGRCRSPKLSIQRVDMTAWAPGEEREQISELGLGGVLTSCQMPMLTGVVMVVDDEGRVLAQARGGEPLDQIERVIYSPRPSPSP